MQAAIRNSGYCFHQDHKQSLTTRGQKKTKGEKLVHNVVSPKKVKVDQTKLKVSEWYDAVSITARPKNEKSQFIITCIHGDHFNKAQ